MRFVLTLLTAVALAQGSFAQNPAWFTEFPNTDFSRSAVDFSEVLDGGPPRDGIPALSDPDFIAVAAAGIPAVEPVVALELPGQVARAYPLRYLTWHEIVNDQVGDTPVAITFCPLCNSAISFDRRVDGETLTFGVSGRLRNSDMIMYDRETESWWQQAIGRGIVGRHMGAELELLPTWVESLELFAARNPDGLVMAEPDYRRQYGQNPYRGYDSADRPFLYTGEMPPHGIAPLARVVRVGARAWPLARIAQVGEVREDGVVLSWQAGQASALDAGRIVEARDIGNIRVRDGAGGDLVHDVMFAFAFHAFFPEGVWMLGE